MDRREFIKSLGLAGGAATGLSSGFGGVFAGAAHAAHHEGGSSASAGQGAMLALLETVRETQAKYLTPENGITTPDRLAEGARALAHILETALFFWLEADPERPVFKPYVTPTRKLLGDNPDFLE